VDPELYFPEPQEAQWDLGYLGTYSADRQPPLEELMLAPARRWPDRKFVVAGPQYPSEIDWPANVERIEHLPPSQHRDFYNRQKFTLNITRDDIDPRRLFVERAALRGGGLRRADHQRPMGRAGDDLHAWR